MLKHLKTSTPVATKPSQINDQRLGKILWLLVEEFDFSISDLAILLDVKERTLYQAKKMKVLPSSSYDRYHRIGLLLGIKKNLEILFPRNPEVRKNWLRVPRSIFFGKSALEMIRANPIESSSRLFTVRRLLDMLRNGSIPALT